MKQITKKVHDPLVQVEIEVLHSLVGLSYGGGLNDSLVVLFILVSGRRGHFYGSATEIDGLANCLDDVLVVHCCNTLIQKFITK